MTNFEKWKQDYTAEDYAIDVCYELGCDRCRMKYRCGAEKGTYECYEAIVAWANEECEE